MSRNGKKAGFTLVELLVVISIIALLAAILMPALGEAREMARAANCLSNEKNVGSTINLAAADNRQVYCQAYHYVNWDGEGSTGYVHWTAMVNPTLYVVLSTTSPADSNLLPKFENQYVCPSHLPLGWAPANFTNFRIPNPPAGQVTENNFDDYQCPRISYCVNEAIMPRKKFGSVHDVTGYGQASSPDANISALKSATYTDNLCLVNQDEIADPAAVILAGEFSNNAAGILGSSQAGGQAYKSHRPSNAVSTAADGGVADGMFNAENNYTPGATSFYQLAYASAMTEISALAATVNNMVVVDASGADDDHIIYLNPNMHKTGSNYVFCDGHAAKYAFADIFGDSGTGNNTYLWGQKMYSCIDKPVINPHK